MPNNRKILIIDDETDLCLLLKDYFVKKDYDVSVSHTITDGMSMLNDSPPDILFLDNNLPDGIGWAQAPLIALEHPQTYIVLVSAFHPQAPDMPLHARYRIIEKPIRIADLNKQFATF